MKNLSLSFLVLFCVCFLSYESVAADYHVIVNGAQQGPVSVEQLQQMANNGSITPDSMVWKDGMRGWEKAGAQEELQSLFAPATPPPLPVAGAMPPPLPPIQSTSTSTDETQKITIEEKQDASVHNFPLPSEIAGNNLEEQRNEYFNKRNEELKKKYKNSKEKPQKPQKLQVGFDRKGSYIGWGMAAIEADPKSIDFGQKRIMAFEKAFADAKGKFVRTKQQKVAGDIVRKKLHIDIKENEVKLKDGKMVGIAKKIAALTEAKLDKALIDLGVDPKEIENSDILKKRALAEDSLSKEIAVEVVQRIPGIRILATFEDLKAVGVLIKQNRKYSNLASAIASRKLVGYPSTTDPADDIAMQLKQKFSDEKNYISQYGVRIMADEAGNRVLVSFGQWSPKITISDSRMKVNMAVSAAKDIAYNQALSYMTQFVNTTLALEDKSKLRDSNTITQITHTDKTTEDKEDSSVGASINTFIKETSNTTLEGVTETMSWSVNHPETGHLIVGKVLMWSPITQEYARQKPRPQSHQANQNKKVREIESKIHKSVDIGDDDF